MSKYFPAQSLAMVVMVCLAVQTLLAVASIGSSLLQVQLLSRMQSGGIWTEEEANLNDLREQAIAVVSIAMGIVTGILFLKYLGRLNHNARAMGADDLSASPGWTIGYFFVPILNLFKPYQILQEIWKASDPEPGDLRQGTPLLGWWWGIRLLDIVANQVAFRLSMQPPGEGPAVIETLLTITWISLGAQILDAVLNLLSLFVIRRFQQRQEERYEKIGESAAVECPSCGEPLGFDIVNETACPVCGAKVQPWLAWAKSQSDA
jgi:hypothetical protein